MSGLRSGKEFRAYALPACVEPEDIISLAKETFIYDDCDLEYPAEATSHECTSEPNTQDAPSSPLNQRQAQDPSPPFKPFVDLQSSFVEEVAQDSKPPPNKKTRKQLYRKKLRAQLQADAGVVHRLRVLERHVKPAVQRPLNSGMDPHQLVNAVCVGGFRGKTVPMDNILRVCGLDEMLRQGFGRVEWDGREDRIFILKNTQAIVSLVGIPKGDDYGVVVSNAYRRIMELKELCHFPSNEPPNRRGTHRALNMGISLGTGSKQPHNLNTGGNRHVEMLALQEPAFQRLAGQASSALLMWYPKIHYRYRSMMQAVLDYGPELRRNFVNSVFPALCINFGPSVSTHKHRDSQNLPFGICAVQALGNFDYKKGGHLVLWEPKLVIEFPPGSLILFPSAIFTHSNIPVQDNEERASIVHFAAGELFRFVDNGFATDKELRQRMPGGNLLKRRREDVWESGLNNYSFLQDLENFSDHHRYSAGTDR